MELERELLYEVGDVVYLVCGSDGVVAWLVWMAQEATPRILRMWAS